MRRGDKRGFTLVELMISSALLAILLGLAYLTFSHLLGTYDRVERKWLVERNVRQTMTLMERAVSLSFQAELANDPTGALTAPENRVLYLDTAGGKVMLRDLDGAEPYALNELPVAVSFSNLDAEGNLRDDLLYFTVSSEDEIIDYSLSTAVHLPNLVQSVSVADGAADPYTVVAFRTAQEGMLELGVGDIDSAGCFIATAAYGDYDQPGVLLLRRFRDQWLLPNPVGEQFVRLYYRYSPPVARWVAQNGALRLLARVLLLPVLGVVTALMHPVFSAAVLLVAFLFGRRVFKGGKRGARGGKSA